MGKSAALNRDFAVQDTHYSQGNSNEDLPGVIGIYRNHQRDSLAGLSADVGLVSIGGRARPVGDVTRSLCPRDLIGVELIAAGDVVRTREAIE